MLVSLTLEASRPGGASYRLGLGCSMPVPVVNSIRLAWDAEENRMMLCGMLDLCRLIFGIEALMANS